MIYFCVLNHPEHGEKQFLYHEDEVDIFIEELKRHWKEGWTSKTKAMNRNERTEQ